MKLFERLGNYMLWLEMNSEIDNDLFGFLTYTQEYFDSKKVNTKSKQFAKTLAFYIAEYRERDYFDFFLHCPECKIEYAKLKFDEEEIFKFLNRTDRPTSIYDIPCTECSNNVT